MKPKSLAQIITILGLALATVIKTSQHSYAESITFFCGNYDKIHATIAQNSQDRILLFIWTSEYFSEAGYTPQRRCIETSSKLQNYHNNGTLNYIFAERQESQLVVCVARRKGGSCFEELFSLSPNSTRTSHILQWMLAIRNRADIISEVEGHIYIDINKYLNRPLVNRRIIRRFRFPGGVFKGPEFQPPALGSPGPTESYGNR